MTPIEVRSSVAQRLRQDLIGPHREDEVLEGRRTKPSDVYLSGILWPLGERLGAAEDDGGSEESEDDDLPTTATPVGQQRPCSMGVSFCVSCAPGADPVVSAAVHFAVYRHEPRVDADGKASGSRWTRVPFDFELASLRVPITGTRTERLKNPDLAAVVELHVRGHAVDTGVLVTLTLINRSSNEGLDRIEAEQLTLFQTELVVQPGPGTVMVPRPPRPAANDEDEEVARLLYRNCPEFASGHQCSAVWEATGSTANLLRTEWLPYATVPAFREDGHSCFESIVESGALGARGLASLDDVALGRRLLSVAEAYEGWISLKRSEVQALPVALREIGERNLAYCGDVASRLRSGATAISSTPALAHAFRLANAAMALQHSWKTDAAGRELAWRPFQLAFILLAGPSACVRTLPDRAVLDLLWFPTGGGKTEAYLAIVAMLAFYRRLSTEGSGEGAGNVALMRYTLRLLTAQQFERASSLILACELIRKNAVPGLSGYPPLGDAHFSIGLWVGGDATPNSFKQALETRGQKDGCTAEQIDQCPCCGGRVGWTYDDSAEAVSPHCESSECRLGTEFGSWPVYTVDSDIYRERPTLLVGTVDKFALVTTKKEVAQLFAFGTSNSTDLIIQDELHLISGPLGTIAGLYEVAFDWLLRKGDFRPKVIGSTATIRRASDQIKALFDREACQFPPPGLDHDDSGFAVRDPHKPQRAYVGVTTAGRSAKFALQAVAGSLLQSAGDTVGIEATERDGYATLLAYFNSLRELGGAIVQMLDDVPDSIALYAERRGEAVRPVRPPRELTSRVSQKEIVEILAELKRRASDPDHVDVVLATNMISVGVDVARLGCMLVNGQPKTRSEYIQATSRVGRSKFPGLVVAVLNAAKPRDRSHYETFAGWHGSIYREVEATSVTPFASRARDRALHAALVAMIRHGAREMHGAPNLAAAPDGFLADVVAELERRVKSIDERELAACATELDERLEDWEARNPKTYSNPRQPNSSLLVSADLYAQRKAAGRLPGAAWPTMNNMRSVEPTTRFRMAEVLRDSSPARGATEGAAGGDAPAKRWRRPGQ